MLPGQLRRQQGATARGALDHHKGCSQGHLQPIATGEVTRLNPATRGKFTDEQSLGTHLGLKGSVVPRIHPFEGGAEDTDRHPSRLKAATMNGPIDSVRQTADDGPTRFGQHGAQSASHEQTMI